ncbi:MAG: hypothetical protein L6V91_00335 [Bacilli bacterium]|nr:MAG: hypothetical protein L6V91_00335 [Bacilli bacterium]
MAGFVDQVVEKYFFRRAASIEKRLEKLEKLDKPEDKKKLNITFDTASRSGKRCINNK